MADKSAKKKDSAEKRPSKAELKSEQWVKCKRAIRRARERERVGALGESSRYRNDNRNTRATTTATTAATTATYAQSANERAAKRTVAKKTATAKR